MVKQSQVTLLLHVAIALATPLDYQCFLGLDTQNHTKIILYCYAMNRFSLIHKILISNSLIVGRNLVATSIKQYTDSDAHKLGYSNEDVARAMYRV